MYLYGSDEKMRTETLYPGQKDRDTEQLPHGQPVLLHISFNASFICFSAKENFNYYTGYFLSFNLEDNKDRVIFSCL